MNPSSPTCIQCGQSEQSVPLLSFQYKGSQHWICPQHLPILIHHPEQLADRLEELRLPGIAPLKS